MLNYIVIMGRLTRDPELRRTPSGRAVCSFTVAVDRDFQPRDGTEKQTDFVDCVAWEQRGEFVSKWFSKGSMIVVEGRLQSRKWQDKAGQNRVSWEINVSNTHFGESKRDRMENAGGSYSAAPSYGSAQGYGTSYGSSQNAYGGASQNGYSGAYGAAPSGGTPSPQSEFSEISDEDGDLPF